MESASVESDYALSVLLNKASIDAGEEVVMNVFIHGAPNLKNGKLVFVGPPDLLKEIKIESFKVDKASNGNSEFRGFQVNDGEPFFNITLNSMLFTRYSNDRSDLWAEQYNGTEKRGPVSISFKTNPQARPGDYEISLKFLHVVGDAMRISEIIKQIHVRFPTERFQTPFSPGLAFILLLTLILKEIVSSFEEFKAHRLFIWINRICGGVWVFVLVLFGISVLKYYLSKNNINKVGAGSRRAKMETEVARK